MYIQLIYIYIIIDSFKEGADSSRRLHTERIVIILEMVIMMIPERLKGVYNLALNGVDGEKESAKKLLDKLLKKYNVSINEIEEEQPEVFHLLFMENGKGSC